ACLRFCDRRASGVSPVAGVAAEQGVPRREAVEVPDAVPFQAAKRVRFAAAPTGEPLVAGCSPVGLSPADYSVRVAVQGEHSAASLTDARLLPAGPAGG